MNEYVVVPAGKNITINLNGKTLSNVGLSDPEAKGVIVNKGTLAIQDSGKDGMVVATTSKVAIANVGELIVKSGKITNAVEKKTGSDGTEYQYVNYLLNNNGMVTIDGGSFVMDERMTKINSSIVKNGWVSTADSVDGNDVVKWESGKVATMTINGGVFKGPTYVKNDNYGEMTINGGSFVTTADVNQMGVTGNCVFNGGKLTVNRGTFDNTASLNAGAPFYVGGRAVASETIINGGVLSSWATAAPARRAVAINTR